MMMSDPLTEIEQFCKDTGMSASAFGRRFMNDPGFVFRLRAGGDLRSRTAKKLTALMIEERGRAAPANRKRQGQPANA